MSKARSLPPTYAQSKYKAVLNFDAAPADAVYFEHDFGNYALEGRIVYNGAHEMPRILSVHGARADYTKSDAVTLGLQARGYSVLSMNMSGHSDAGVLDSKDTSLRNNIQEVAAFFTYLDPNRPRIEIGYSLGGTPVLKLLERHNSEIDKLILFYPGIYTTEAYQHNFGDAFRQTISRPFSYRDNDTVALLKQFKGNVLLVVGEYDGLDPLKYGKPAGSSAGEVHIDGKTYYSPIPKDVITMLSDAVPAGRLTYIQVPKCGHSIVLWMRDNPEAAADLLQRIDTFLKS